MVRLGLFGIFLGFVVFVGVVRGEVVKYDIRSLASQPFAPVRASYGLLGPVETSVHTYWEVDVRGVETPRVDVIRGPVVREGHWQRYDERGFLVELGRVDPFDEEQVTMLRLYRYGEKGEYRGYTDTYGSWLTQVIPETENSYRLAMKNPDVAFQIRTEDDQGRLIRIESFPSRGDAGPSSVQTFTYDSLGRLIEDELLGLAYGSQTVRRVEYVGSFEGREELPVRELTYENDQLRSVVSNVYRPGGTLFSSHVLTWALLPGEWGEDAQISETHSRFDAAGRTVEVERSNSGKLEERYSYSYAQELLVTSEHFTQLPSRAIQEDCTFGGFDAYGNWTRRDCEYTTSGTAAFTTATGERRYFRERRTFTYYD